MNTYNGNFMGNESPATKRRRLYKQIGVINKEIASAHNDIDFLEKHAAELKTELAEKYKQFDMIFDKE